MSYEFKTELFGLIVVVEGEFEPGEQEDMINPGWPPCFTINTITHMGYELEIDSLTYETLDSIEELAFAKVNEERE